MIDVVVVGASGVVVCGGVAVEDPVIVDGVDGVGADVVVEVGQGSLPLITVLLMQIA